MTSLALRLAGPLQSWGAGSRFDTRATTEAPTKSGVIGLLLAAVGVDRDASLDDYMGLRFGVRLDQPGTQIRDFHTLRVGFTQQSMKITERHYLSDAAFLAVVEGDKALLEGFVDALRNPTFPLYLGRRSCPPAGPLRADIFDGGVADVLQSHPWVASQPVRARHGSATVALTALRDALPGDSVTFEQIDNPVTFNTAHRLHSTRRVHRSVVYVSNDQHTPAPVDVTVADHDPFTFLEN